MRTLISRKTTWLVLLVLASLAGITWWQRQTIQAWHQVRQLRTADEVNRAGCAKSVAELQETALPWVLAELRSTDPVACGNMQYALLLMAKDWGLADRRSQNFVENLETQFAAFSLEGQEKTVLLLAALLHHEGPKPLPPTLTRPVSEIMVTAERRKELRGAALQLAAELIVRVQPGQWVDVCRGMAERGMKDERPAARIAAVQMLLCEPMGNARDLVEKAIPLLSDPDAEVRRATLVALAGDKDVVREEQFLPLLHDADAQVQVVCDWVLRKRGLTDDDIGMARLISHKDPAVRLMVFRYFPRRPDINLGEWLRRLSHDPEPAVRSAAVRAAAESASVDLSQRLREMAEQDPSETVRENARYYLRGVLTTEAQRTQRGQPNQ